MQAYLVAQIYLWYASYDRSISISGREKALDQILNGKAQDFEAWDQNQETRAQAVTTAMILGRRLLARRTIIAGSRAVYHNMFSFRASIFIPDPS